VATNTNNRRRSAAPKVVEVDFDDYEEGYEVYDGDAPPTGFHTFELVSYDQHTSQAGNEGLKWVFRLTEEPWEGWTRTVYSNLDPQSTKWKTQEIVKAIQGGKEAALKLGFSDAAKAALLKKAKPVRARVQWRKDSDREDENDLEIGRIIVLDEAKMAARRKAAGVDEEEVPWDEGDDEPDDDADAEFEDAEEFEDDAEDAEDEDEEDEAEDEEDDDSEEDEDYDEDDEEGDEEDEEDEPEEEPAPPARRKATTKAASTAKKTTANVTPISRAKRRSR
jgi:hypothetical protein